MDIALPALALAPVPQPSPGQDAADLATDAAFAALLASLVAATAPQAQLVGEAVPATGAPAPALAPSALVAAGVALAQAIDGDGAAQLVGGQVPVTDDADARTAAVALEARPALAAAAAAAGTSTARHAATGDAGDPAPATAGPGDGDGDGVAAGETPARAPGSDRPARGAAERVVPQPVAPPDSARLLAQAVPATATITAADSDTDAGPDTMQPVAVAAAVDGTPEVRPTEAPKAPAATAPPRPAEQIVRVVAPLRASPDGSYELGLELRPEGLGRVQLDVVIERGVVHVAMRADTEAASQLLNRSLGELRQGLADAGLEAGRLGVQSDTRDGGRQTSPERSDADADRRHGGSQQSAPDDRPPTAPAYADARLGGVDLFL